MSNANYLTPTSLVKDGSGRKLHKALASVLMAFVFITFAASSVFVGQSQKVAAQEDEGFDVVRWVMCLWGDDALPGMIYQATQTSDIQFALQSKSVISPGVDDVEMGPLGMNWMLDATGGSFKKTNEDILGRSLDPTDLEAAGAEPGAYNGGPALNPFDRFGVAGLNWTGYAGEWKYVIVKACYPGQIMDPKAAMFYEKRLPPLSVWEDRENSQDVRTQQHAAGLGTSLTSSFTNLVANFIFNIAKLIIVVTLSLINFAFADLVELMGLDEFLVGNGDNTGMFGKLFTGIFEPFIMVAFTLTGLNILWHGIVKRAFRHSLNVLIRSLILFFVAFIIAAQPATFISLPNNVAVGIQSLMVTGLNQGLAGGNGLCATDAGITNTQIVENTTADDLNILDQASKNMRSAIGCSFWQQFLLKPWAQGQYGSDWNKLWAKEKIPGWAPEGATALNNGIDNKAMVGDAEVPIGDGRFIYNWAIYQISTQTNAHSPTGRNGEYSKYTSGVANDWWRIVDVLADYEEVTKEAVVGSQAGEGDNTNEDPGSVSGAKTWPTPTKIPLSGNYNGHSGIDIPVVEGTPAIASMDGVVTKLRANDGKSYGLAIYVKFADGNEAVYAHLSAQNVSVNDTFTAGQTLGLTGNTGNSDGPHLHFEINPVGSVFGAEANRGSTIAWLEGSVPGQTDPGTGVPNDTVVKYNVPKNNPHLAQWDQWVGNNIFNRLATALSAVFVALIGVIAPLFFAFLTAIYALGVGILMAFAPLMLLLGCWAGPGWEMFKSWGQLVINTLLKRIAAGVLMVLSIAFSAAAIKIMESESWWEGIMLMVLLSVILIRSRHKIIDAFAAVRFASHDFSGSANKLSGKMMGTVKGGAKNTGNLAFAGAVGSLSAKRHGGSALSGMGQGMKTEFRNMSYRNQTVRAAMRTYDSSRQQMSIDDPDSGLSTKNQYCTQCGNPLDENSEATVDGLDNYYCSSECAQDAGKSYDDLSTVYIRQYDPVKKVERKELDTKSEYYKSNVRYRSYDLNEDKEDVAPELDEVKFIQDIGTITQKDIEEYQRLKRDSYNVNPPQPPDKIQPYLDMAALKEAWEKDSTGTAVKHMYATAWALWAMETFEEAMPDLYDSLLREMSNAAENAENRETV